MKIEITGRQGEGKTTVAGLIAETLRAAGYTVDVQESDVMPVFPFQRLKTQSKNANTVVTITTRNE